MEKGLIHSQGFLFFLKPMYRAHLLLYKGPQNCDTLALDINVDRAFQLRLSISSWQISIIPFSRHFYSLVSRMSMWNTWNTSVTHETESTLILWLFSTRPIWKTKKHLRWIEPRFDFASSFRACLVDPGSLYMIHIRERQVCMQRVSE